MSFCGAAFRNTEVVRSNCRKKAKDEGDFEGGAKSKSSHFFFCLSLKLLLYSFFCERNEKSKLEVLLVWPNKKEKKKIKYLSSNLSVSVFSSAVVLSVVYTLDVRCHAPRFLAFHPMDSEVMVSLGCVKSFVYTRSISICRFRPVPFELKLTTHTDT